LSDEFINDAQKVRQWRAFVRKNALDPIELSAVITDVRDFLLPVLLSAATGADLDMRWRPGDQWQ